MHASPSQQFGQDSTRPHKRRLRSSRTSIAQKRPLANAVSAKWAGSAPCRRTSGASCALASVLAKTVMVAGPPSAWVKAVSLCAGVKGGVKTQPWRLPFCHVISASARPAPARPMRTCVPAAIEITFEKQKPLADRSSTVTSTGSASIVLRVLGLAIAARGLVRRQGAAFIVVGALTSVRRSNRSPRPARQKK